MKNLLTILLLTISMVTNAAIDIDMDTLRSPDHTKSYSFPSTSQAMLGATETATITNKTISGSSNTITNVTATNIPNLTGDVTSVNTVTTIPSSTVTNSMLAGSIAYGKLSLSNSILNADINSSASIAYSKLASIPTGSILLGNAGVPTVTALSGGATVGATGVVTLGNSAVITQLLTGYVSGAGTVSASDSILQAIQKLDGNSSNASVIARTLTGYTAGAGTVSSSDSILSAIQKVDGNDALKVLKSTVTAKGDLIGATASSTVSPVAVGADGYTLIGDSNNSKGLSYRQQNPDVSQVVQFTAVENINTWSTGNNASIMGGGSIAGTFAKETSTPFGIWGSSYKFTQASGSLNDYWCSPTVSLPSQFKGPTLYFSTPYVYNGSSGDIQAYIYDATNSVTYPLNNIQTFDAANSAIVAISSTSFPSTVNSVRLCYQVKVANNGKILSYVNTQLGTSLNQFGSISNYNFSDTVDFTPIFSAGFNTPTVTSAKWWRMGEFFYAKVKFTTTSVSGTVATMNLPSGLVTDSSYSTYEYGGWVAKGNAQAITNNIIVAPSSTTVGFSGQGSTNASLTSYNVNDIFAATTAYSALIGPIKIQGWSGSSPGVSAPSQQLSSDTISFAFKSSAISSTDPIGTFNTYKKATSQGSSPTLCTTAPTQTTASMNANGIFLTGTAYNAASSDATPSAVEIYVGPNLKATTVDAYFGTAKTTPLVVTEMTNTTSAQYGAQVTYNQVTGILRIEVGDNYSSATTTRNFKDQGSVDRATGYFVFNTSTIPSIAAIPQIGNAYYPGLTKGQLLLQSKVAFGTTNSTTDCSTNPCLLFNPQGNLISTIGRTGGGIYSVVLNNTCAVARCEVNGYHGAVGNGTCGGYGVSTSSNTVIVNTSTSATTDCYGLMTCTCTTP